MVSIEAEFEEEQYLVDAAIRNQQVFNSMLRILSVVDRTQRVESFNLVLLEFARNEKVILGLEDDLEL